MRKNLFILVAVGMIMGLVISAYAQYDSDQAKVVQNKFIEVGNKICPVMGEKIDEQSKETYEYQGKIYNFCCPMCIEQFKKDPEKYIKIIEIEKNNN